MFGILGVLVPTECGGCALGVLCVVCVFVLCCVWWVWHRKYQEITAHNHENPLLGGVDVAIPKEIQGFVTWE